ncbi:hypothetical protein DPMN_187696 [Dreissena polymorpha]|uniref:Uncharacterized protein n=1 Tax=Dreissena polymorpha TaxID=45954 RepID=A0A9D4DPJ6_DREPO|nr:hypothetical protein DPMN_187696 [Dreissena polymorpha]
MANNIAILKNDVFVFRKPPGYFRHLLCNRDSSDNFAISYINLNASDSGLHHTVSLMYVGGRHIGFGTTLENKMAAPS